MRKLVLAAEIVVTWVQVRVLLSHSDLPAALGRLRGSRARETASPPVETGQRLAHAVARTLAVVRPNSRCLVQSLVLTRLLARRGIETRLVISVRPGERFAAHAWVEQGGVALLPPSAPPFEQLVAL